MKLRIYIYIYRRIDGYINVCKSNLHVPIILYIYIYAYTCIYTMHGDMIRYVHVHP